MGRILGIVVLSLLAAMPISYFVFGHEIRSVDELRAHLPPGRLLETGQGLTFYETAGESWKPRIILLHGGTVPSLIWDDYMAPLVAAGYQVARFDFYGRGYSDRVSGPYDRDLHVQQLADVIKALGWDDRPVDLLGYSMGGAIAATFTARHPERVGNLALIAPVVDYSEHIPGFLQVPLLGEWFIRVVGVPMSVGRINTMADGIARGGAVKARFLEQSQTRGFERLLLSILREDTLGDDYRDVYRQLADREALLIWGQQDQEIPAAHIEFLRETIPGIHYQPVPGAGHEVGAAHSQLVLDLLVPWMFRNG